MELSSVLVGCIVTDSYNMADDRAGCLCALTRTNANNNNENWSLHRCERHSTAAIPCTNILNKTKREASRRERNELKVETAQIKRSINHPSTMDAWSGRRQIRYPFPVTRYPSLAFVNTPAHVPKTKKDQFLLLVTVVALDTNTYPTHVLK